ncbi:hypothetical protein [Oceanobacillus kapialis]|uniref:hypothetical protein n=1 Tax=Oceanobacillus kapialis TaxID=481353 RepID=UPI00384BF238
MADENGAVGRFEDLLISKAEQSYRTGKNKIWVRIAELYQFQKERLSHHPYPEEYNEALSEDDTPPVIKKIDKNTSLKELYRWGIQGGKTGNHRILYTLHNYEKVVLLHYFDKRYNGAIKVKNILPAEKNYSNYCIDDPSHYPIF